MEDQKRRQVEYHEREHYRAGKPRQADNHNPLIAALNGYRLKKLLTMIGTPLAGKTVLSVCGGDGEEADFLQRQGALVTMTELSKVGVETARVRNPSVQCLTMDSEMLAFANESFDWAVVRDGLHHLARPLKGLYELERVCREGFAVVEGQDSLLVRLLVQLGFGENWDDGGGYTYRFSRRELQKFFYSVQTIARWEIYTTWLPPGSDAMKLLPGIQYASPALNNGFLSRLLCSDAGRASLKALFRCVESIAGRWGNSLIVVAWKKPNVLQ